MIHFFGNESTTVFAVQSQKELSIQTIAKLNWLFNSAFKIEKSALADFFVGPRASMITPWSTNAVEITQNMGIENIVRIEQFVKVSALFVDFDSMLSEKYNELNQNVFSNNLLPEPVLEIDDIALYNTTEGLALSNEEVLI